MSITERLENLTAADVAAEIEALETTYREKRKRLNALLRVLEVEQGTPQNESEENDGDNDDNEPTAG